MKKIYIVCPTSCATGGTELLHQLCYKLNKLNIKAYMFYVGEIVNSPVEKKFSEYMNPIALTIEDDKNNMLIVPETMVMFLYKNMYKYKNVKKSIWWLSVDFYFEKLCPENKFKYKVKETLFDLFKNSWFHFAQSEYAIEYLVKRKVNQDSIFYLSDYLNSTYIIDASKENTQVRQNTILYNPKKGFEFTNLLMTSAPELEWVPLQNLTNTEMKNILKNSKVYIDFGNHPGKDRIPREAAISGCCVITSLRGSAKNNKDVPIPQEYKIEDIESNIPLIIDKIKQCLFNYDIVIEEFESYKTMIYAEEIKFEQDVIKCFKG